MRSTAREPHGGKNSIAPEATGAKRCSLNSRPSWEALKGEPWPKGVASARAQRPWRFGTRTRDAPVGPHHPPYLLQHRTALLAELEAVDDKDAVDAAVGQRQEAVIGQRDLAPAALRPSHDPLARRHDGEHPVRLLTEEPEEGHRVAEPQHHLLAHARPHPADLLAQYAPRDPAEPGQVEGVEIDDVLMHRRVS